MQINYETWDLSATDWIMVTAMSMGMGISIGWLFYDSQVASLGCIMVAFSMVKKRYCLWKVEQRKKQLLLQIRDLLYSISSSVAVCRSKGQALEEAMEFWQGTYTSKDYIMKELAAMVAQMKESNTSEVTVLGDFAKRSGLKDIGDFVQVYMCCRTSGANMLKAIDHATEMIGDKISLEQELHTWMAQKRFESRIILLAPFLLMLLLKVLSTGYLEPLTASTQGYMVSSMALCMIGAACILMERMNQIEL